LILTLLQADTPESSLKALTQ